MEHQQFLDHVEHTVRGYMTTLGPTENVMPALLIGTDDELNVMSLPQMGIEGMQQLGMRMMITTITLEEPKYVAFVAAAQMRKFQVASRKEADKLVKGLDSLAGDPQAIECVVIMYATKDYVRLQQCPVTRHDASAPTITFEPIVQEDIEGMVPDCLRMGFRQSEALTAEAEDIAIEAGFKSYDDANSNVANFAHYTEVAKKRIRERRNRTGIAEFDPRDFIDAKLDRMSGVSNDGVTMDDFKNAAFDA